MRELTDEERERKLTIGEVSVYAAGEEWALNNGLVGSERYAGLVALYTGKGIEAYQYVAWNPLREVVREDVNWETSGIPGTVKASEESE